MDNLFEILIYLIIIISFLSGIFRKKDKQKRPVAMQQRTVDEAEKKAEAFQAQQHQEYDIIKEIEDFFKVGEREMTPGQITLTQPQQRINKVELEEHIKQEEWHQPTVSEHEYTAAWEPKKQQIPETLAKTDMRIKKRAAEFEEYLKREKTAATEIAVKIKAKLKSPSSLKDYIIIAEIMGKPKAFRR